MSKDRKDVGVWGESDGGRGNSKCKVPEVGQCPACSRSSRGPCGWDREKEGEGRKELRSERDRCGSRSRARGLVGHGEDPRFSLECDGKEWGGSEQWSDMI